MHPSNPTQQLSRNVIDQNGKPIKDAIIGIHFDMGDDFNQAPHIDYFTTVTDDFGVFYAIPYDYSFPFSNSAGIAALKISAPGAERKKWGWCPSCINLPSPISLKKVDFKYDGEIENQIITASSFPANFKGWNTLSLKDIDIQSGYNGEFLARKKINIANEFHASFLSEVHIFCNDIVFADCNDYLFYTMQRHSNILQNNGTSDGRKIELTFKVDGRDLISISPNPTHGKLKIKLNDVAQDDRIDKILIYNSVGCLIFTRNIDNRDHELDLSNLEKGVYIAKIITYYNSELKKVVVN